MRRTLLSLGLLALLGGPAAAQAPGDWPEAFNPGGPVRDGKRATCDLPEDLHIRNVGGSDGLGLCVFTSLNHAAIWQRVTQLYGFQKWMRARPGGGWPEKVDQTIAAYARSKGVPAPKYVQHTGGDEEFLELALKTGRMPSVTYDGRDDFYRGRIAHMVNLVHLDGERACIVDNNRPGVFVWMTRAEFLSRWRGNGGGWAVALLDPPPPPYPGPPQQTVFGQCPGGRCPLPAAPVVAPLSLPAAEPHEWRPDVGGWYRLVRGPSCPGMWHPARGYFAWDGVAFAREATPPPVPPPALPDLQPEQLAPPAAEFPPGGVDVAKVNQGRKYWVNGSPCDRDECLGSFGAPGLPDDSARFNLAVVGDDAFRGRVRADLAAADPALRDRVHLQEFAPDEWQVRRFQLGGGLTLRKPAVDRVGADVGTLGVADYTPAKLLDLLRLILGPPPAPPPPPPPSPNDPHPGPLAPPAPPPCHNALAWAVLAVVVIVLATRR